MNLIVGKRDRASAGLIDFIAIYGKDTPFNLSAETQLNTPIFLSFAASNTGAMQLESLLVDKVKQAVLSLYGVRLDAVELQPTRKDFEGDITVVVFPMLRQLKGNPEVIGNAIGDFLTKEMEEIAGFNR